MLGEGEGPRVGPTAMLFSVDNMFVVSLNNIFYVHITPSAGA